MYRPGLNDLDAVIAIARRASFRAAALDLGMSTTALSNAVGKLEAEPWRPPVQSDDAQRLAHRCRTRVRRTGRPGLAGHSRRHGSGAVAAGNAVRHAAHQRLCHGGARDPLAAGAGVPPPLPAGACRSRHRRTAGRHRRRGFRSRGAGGRPRAQRHDRGFAWAATAICRRRLAGVFREAWQAACPA